MATTTEPPTQPSGCSSTTTVPSSPSCSITRCQQHRRTVRRQLQRWSKNVVYLVGFEEVAKSMMGSENWLKTTAQYSNNHHTSEEVTSGSPSTIDAQVLRDFDPENPQVVHDPLCPMKISNMVDTIDQVTVPDSLPQLLSNNCSCDPPVDECPTCIDMMDNSSGNEDSISESSFNESSEQPLDLSIKGVASSPSTTISKQMVSSVQESSKMLRTSSPSILKPSTPRKSKAPKNWNRCYTEEALAQALDAIERGELGTRRAALIYKVPRSTLRNKVYKLNLRPSSRKKNAASNSNQEERNPSTLSSLLLDRKRGMVSDPSNDSGFESSIKGHTSEALREMLLKRESVKSASTTSLFQPQLQPQSTIPSSPLSLESSHVGNVEPSLSTIPSFGMESLLTGSDPQSESLKFLYLIHLYQYAQQLQSSNGSSNLNSNQQQQQHNNEAAPVDWQQIFQLWNQFSCNANNSLQCNPLLFNQSNPYESSMPESQSLKSRFDQESDQSRILGDYLPLFGTQQSFKSTPSTTSIVNNNSGATGSSQVILKVPSYKSKGNRSSQNTLIQSKPGAMMNISSPSSPLDQDEVGDDGFESKPIRIKSEESSLLETTKISRKKSRRSLENQSSHDQSNDGSNRNRPKRGRYRNYNREDLERAVKAVQDGSMSVHKAGNHFGVPHSTLEYKVKDRRTLRQKKQLQDSTDEVSTRNSRTSSTDSVPSNIPGVQAVTNDGNNDSNNNSLWNEQVSGTKSTEHSLFIASEKMRKLHEMVQNDGKNQSIISSSNGLFMVTPSKLNPSSVQSSSNPDSNDGQDDDCMDVPESNRMQSSLNVLKEVIGSSSLPETAL